jgi:hypothetical protein
MQFGNNVLCATELLKFTERHAAIAENELLKSNEHLC